MKRADTNTIEWSRCRYQEGYNCSEIGKAVGMSPSAIGRIIKDLPKIKDFKQKNIKFNHLPDLIFNEKKLTVNELFRAESIEYLEKFKSRSQIVKPVVKPIAKVEVLESIPTEFVEVESKNNDYIVDRTMSMFIQARRGDIFYANIPKTIGSVLYGIRPVVIVQSNMGNFLGTTLICIAGTSNIREHIVTNVILPANTFRGLTDDTCFLGSQIITICKSQLTVYVGSIVNTDFEDKINVAMKISLEFLENISLRFKASHFQNEIEIQEELKEKVQEKIQEIEEDDEEDDEVKDTFIAKVLKGAFYLKCEHCSVVSYYFLKEYADSIPCKYCEKPIPILNTIKYSYWCGCSDHELYGRTNFDGAFNRVCGNRNCLNIISFDFNSPKNKFIGEVTKIVKN